MSPNGIFSLAIGCNLVADFLSLDDKKPVAVGGLNTALRVKRQLQYNTQKLTNDLTGNV